MLKPLIFALLFLSLYTNAQDSLFVKLSPKSNYDRLMLYQLEGAQQKYVGNSKVDQGVFKLVFPENNEPGMYRLFFDVQNQVYFDVIYNNEPISIEFNPENPLETVVIRDSKENKIYMSYQQSFYKIQAKLDSLQLVYFNAESDSIATVEEYSKEVDRMYEMQHAYEQMSIELLANSYIKSNKVFFPKEIIESVEEFAIVTKVHFFDFIDFSNKELMKSSFFIDKSAEYIFYMNEAEDKEKDITLKKMAIDELMFQIDENYEVKNEILVALLYNFAGQLNIELVNYTINEHYSKLPSIYQNKDFIIYINDMLKAVVGTAAPDIIWEEEGVQNSLNNMENSQVYLIVFWSTSCSHCLNDIPKLYDFIDEFEGIKVIAVALEEEKMEFDKLILTMPNWIHIYGNGKWENEFARNYNVNSTPSYFVLDKDKNIIAKPEEFEDVMALFNEE